jgi:hypothetical protein
MPPYLCQCVFIVVQSSSARWQHLLVPSDAVISHVVRLLVVCGRVGFLLFLLSDAHEATRAIDRKRVNKLWTGIFFLYINHKSLIQSKVTFF